MIKLSTKKWTSITIFGISALLAILVFVFLGLRYHGRAKNSIPSSFSVTAQCPSKPAASARFCLKTPAVVRVDHSGSTCQVDLSTKSSELGLWSNSALAFRFSSVDGPINVKNYSTVTAKTVTGTVTVSYKEFSISVGNNGLNLYYAGNGEMGILSSSVVSAKYTPIAINARVNIGDGQQLVMTSETIKIGGKTVPATQVPGAPGSPSDASTPALPPGMKYTSVHATKTGLVFYVSGTKQSLLSVFPNVHYQGVSTS